MAEGTVRENENDRNHQKNVLLNSAKNHTTFPVQRNAETEVAYGQQENRVSFGQTEMLCFLAACRFSLYFVLIEFA